MMKKPVKIKIDYFIEQYKIMIYLIFSFLVFIVLAYGIYLFKGISSNISSSTMGILGGLLGAILGGILTLYASIYVNNNQLKSKSAIQRRDIIYKPLYDELIEISNIVKKENPYPRSISFNKGLQTLIRHPQFCVWGSIKNDSRFLQTPQYLADSFEELYQQVKDYLNNVGNACFDIQGKVNEILLVKHNTTCTLINLGEVILTDIILRKKPIGELFKYTFENALEPKRDLSENELVEIEELVYEQCHKLNSVQSLITSYQKWINTQDQIIDTLRSLIKLISMKYEKLNDKY